MLILIFHFYGHNNKQKNGYLQNEVEVTCAYFLTNYKGMGLFSIN